MSRKVKLSPTQNQILRLLEEAGEENLYCLAATLNISDDAGFQEEIVGLERLGYVIRGHENNLPSLVLTAEGRVALTR